MHRIPRIAAVNDLSGFGRCSLAVAMPQGTPRAASRSRCSAVSTNSASSSKSRVADSSAMEAMMDDERSFSIRERTSLPSSLTIWNGWFCKYNMDEYLCNNLH